MIKKTLPILVLCAITLVVTVCKNSNPNPIKTMIPRAEQDFGRYTNDELVQQSELIVMGEIVEKTQINLKKRQIKLNVAILRIDEFLKGDEGPQFILLELPWEGGIPRSDYISYNKGQKGLWFLQKRSSDDLGLYWANHPQRFVTRDQAIQEIEKIQEIIQQK